jgi:hypothetical protein
MHTLASARLVRFLMAAVAAAAVAIVSADEGMWRIQQLPADTIAQKYGVKLTPGDLERLQYAPVRILSGGGGGTGTFASPDGLILTNHHVALDCIRSRPSPSRTRARGTTSSSTGSPPRRGPRSCPASASACRSSAAPAT